MATGAQTWSTTAASNNSADSSVNWAEGMAPSAVNNSARAEMASAAMWIGDNSGVISTTGTSSAYTITSKQVSTAVVDGYTIAAKIHATNSAAATLNVDGVGAKAIDLYAGTALAGGEFLVGSIQRFTYNSASTSWVINNYRPASVSSLLAADGTVGAPSHSFTNDTDCGLYRIGANNIGFSIGGGKVQDLSTSGVVNTGIFTVSGALTAQSSATITGNALLSGTATVSGKLTASSSVEVTGAALFSGALAVSGTATLSSSLTVANGTLLSSGLIVAGAATLQSSLTVTGAALMNGAVTLAGGATFSSSVAFAAASFSGKLTASSSSEHTGDSLFSGGVTVASTINAATIGGAVVATQAQQETGTATNVVVTPGRQHYHPGMAKAWAYVSVSGGTPALTAGYNAASVTDVGAGITRVNFTNALSSGNYAAIATAVSTDETRTVAQTAQIYAQATTGITVMTHGGGGVVDNINFYVVVFGDI